ncbi:hypothetical protein [Primorskyibacter sp. S187A]|uniref:hypothetical protein n=1 Tax=Primorskyibacter sp. S187A TaxID=3415130 RepID=UPI003C7BB4C8
MKRIFVGLLAFAPLTLPASALASYGPVITQEQAAGLHVTQTAWLGLRSIADHDCITVVQTDPAPTGEAFACAVPLQGN